MKQIKSYNKSFNADFCVKLEGAITRAFAYFEQTELRKFWCDGVLHAPFYNDDVNREYLLFENVKKRGTIETTSWNGLDGQTEYKTTIHLGAKSLKIYEQGNDLTESIPNDDDKDWIEMSLENKELEVFLL